MIEEDKKYDKKIDIGYKKICDCPVNHINCLDAKTWLKSQLGVWQFYYEKRDIRKKTLHPGKRNNFTGSSRS